MERIMRAYTYDEDFVKALRTSEDIIKQFPKSYVGYKLKGHVLGSFLMKPKKAIRLFNKAWRLSINNSVAQVDVLCSRSNNYLQLENWKKALSDAEKGLRINSGDSTLILNKALALEKLGRKDDVKKLIEKILPIIEADYERAIAYARLGDKTNMLKKLTKAINDFPANRVRAKFDPDFLDFRDDPEFKKIIEKKK
jgi:tetratricopeptide (TPR) repeat protein